MNDDGDDDNDLEAGLAPGEELAQHPAQHDGAVRLEVAEAAHIPRGRGHY